MASVVCVRSVKTKSSPATTKMSEIVFIVADTSNNLDKVFSTLEGAELYCKRNYIFDYEQDSCMTRLYDCGNDTYDFEVMYSTNIYWVHTATIIGKRLLL